MVDSKRIERLREQIKAMISEIIHAQLKDPDVGMVTVTAVELTRDLSEAKIFYSVLGDVLTRKKSKRALERARGYIQTQLAGALHIRKSPTVSFVVDKSTDHAMRIQELLDQIKREETKEE